jgi:hypothetical protein
VFGSKHPGVASFSAATNIWKTCVSFARKAAKIFFIFRAAHTPACGRLWLFGVVSLIGRHRRAAVEVFGTLLAVVRRVLVRRGAVRKFPPN